MPGSRVLRVRWLEVGRVAALLLLPACRDDASRTSDELTPAHAVAQPHPARSRNGGPWDAGVAPDPPSEDPAPSARPSARFVVIGDYGTDSPAEAAVAALVASLAPEFVITTGDNNYPSGERATIDANIGKYFHHFIAPYGGSYGPGARTNRFFPSLGNHDWYTDGARPYFEYFTLPNNERYYDVREGPVHLFALDSDVNEPDGITADSLQGRWLQRKLNASNAPWKVIYFHHSPYSSGPHAGQLEMRWPFRAWGASIVFTGHDHTYERLLMDGFPYVVNGVGGMGLYTFNAPLPETVSRDAERHGAVLVVATADTFTSRFTDTAGVVRDELVLHAPPR